jgi:hypothetical protein
MKMRCMPVGTSDTQGVGWCLRCYWCGVEVKVLIGEDICEECWKKWKGEKIIREIGDIVTINSDIIDRDMYVGNWNNITTGQIVAILGNGLYLFKNSWNEQRITEEQINEV